MAKRFSKVLAARHSPKNKCYAADGEVLSVKPLVDVPLRDHVSHHFVSTSSDGTTSKYGWVTDTQPFDLDDFILERMSGRTVNETERAHLETMFDSIAKLKPGTPVAATYSRRGVERKRMEFTVHRVVFYKART